MLLTSPHSADIAAVNARCAFAIAAHPCIRIIRARLMSDLCHLLHFAFADSRTVCFNSTMDVLGFRFHKTKLSSEAHRSLFSLFALSRAGKDAEKSTTLKRVATSATSPRCRVSIYLCAGRHSTYHSRLCAKTSGLEDLQRHLSEPRNISIISAVYIHCHS